MGHTVTIKCTETTGLGVHLHGDSLTEPLDVSLEAMQKNGATRVLDPGDFTIVLINQYHSADGLIEWSVKGTSGQKTGKTTTTKGKSYYRRGRFRLDASGAVS